MPEIGPANIHGVEKLFAGLVFKMFLKENTISEELVEKMCSWKHSGFSVRCSSIISDIPMLSFIPVENLSEYLP